MAVDIERAHGGQPGGGQGGRHAGRPQGRYYRPLVDNRPFCLNGRYS